MKDVKVDLWPITKSLEPISENLGS
jgi:hypothetical protein